MSIINDGVARKHELITLNTANVYTLNSAVYTITPGLLPTGAVIGPVETQDVRYTIHGVDPVVATKVGHLLASGSEVVLSGTDNVVNFRVVREAAVTAYIPITYLY